jgi:hypothetical protein
MIALWSVVLFLLMTWSLLAWGLHALVQGDLSWLSQVGPWLATTPLAAWVPEWQGVLDWLVALVRGVAEWLPAIVVVAWAAGGLALLALAGLASAGVMILRRLRGGGGGGSGRPPMTAAA